MCGFAGFVGSVDDREQVLVNMMNTIIHRGPDSEGKYVDEDAALGFRRLSIIDLSSVGDQPLYNEDKSMVLVFNGEIYNYQELKKELQDAGHTFVSNTDSETLIHGYEEKEIICGKGYFRNQTAVLCTDEWNADVCIRDQGIYGASEI